MKVDDRNFSELIDKRRQVKINRDKYETLQQEIRGECDQAREKWSNKKCREINLYQELLLRRCTETLKKSHKTKPVYTQIVLTIRVKKKKWRKKS